MTNIAVVKPWPIEIDDFPMNTSIYKGFSMAMLNNQMIYIYIYIMSVQSMIMEKMTWKKLSSKWHWLKTSQNISKHIKIIKALARAKIWRNVWWTLHNLWKDCFASLADRSEEGSRTIRAQDSAKYRSRCTNSRWDLSATCLWAPKGAVCEPKNCLNNHHHHHHHHDVHVIPSFSRRLLASMFASLSVFPGGRWRDTCSSQEVSFARRRLLFEPDTVWVKTGDFDIITVYICIFYLSSNPMMLGASLCIWFWAVLTCWAVTIRVYCNILPVYIYKASFISILFPLYIRYCFPVACGTAKLSFTSSPKVRLPGSHQTSQLLREDGRVSHLSIGLCRLTAQKILRGFGNRRYLQKWTQNDLWELPWLFPGLMVKFQGCREGFMGYHMLSNFAIYIELPQLL